jgi:acyl-CoA-binding protein
MSKKDYKRLVQLHAMLGSTNVGEAESARQRILELLSRYRKNWSDLTNLLKDDAKADADTWTPAWDDNRSAEQRRPDWR